jgi:hypothetical protein
MYSFNHAAKVELSMPQYFKDKGYKCPGDIADGPFQYAFNTKLSFFEFLNQDASKLKTFNTFMTGNRSTRRHWVEWFPVSHRLLEGWERKNENDILLVDMGGGSGHDLEHFLKAFPSTAGHLVLQDLPSTIESLNGFHGTFKSMAHDLFKPQPIKGKLNLKVNSKRH